jgi:hypothetical protein
LRHAVDERGDPGSPGSTDARTNGLLTAAPTTRHAVLGDRPLPADHRDARRRDHPVGRL